MVGKTNWPYYIIIYNGGKNKLCFQRSKNENETVEDTEET
jgi:hypothetical protein